MQKFNYHSHTYRCVHADQDMADEDYIKEYIEMGFKKIAFTDHCPEKNEIDKRTNMRMKYSQKEEYLDSIRMLKEKYADKIEIESGYEVEYLPGEERNIQELKSEADKIIIGQHFIYDKNKQLKILGKHDFSEEEIIEYANYIEKAIELGIPNIIAHPDIYMFKRKEFGKSEAKVANKICKVAEKYNIPLEINLAKIFNTSYYKDRKLNNDSLEIQRKRVASADYPRKEFWKIATNYNIKVLYGIDVHHKGQIKTFNNLVTLANEIIGEDIVKKLDFINDI